MWRCCVSTWWSASTETFEHRKAEKRTPLSDWPVDVPLLRALQQSVKHCKCNAFARNWLAVLPISGRNLRHDEETGRRLCAARGREGRWNRINVECAKIRNGLLWIRTKSDGDGRRIGRPFEAFEIFGTSHG